MAVAKLYTSHDALEGVQFRTQTEIAEIADMAIVVRELADKFYVEFADESASQKALTTRTPWGCNWAPVIVRTGRQSPIIGATVRIRGSVSSATCLFT